MPATTKNTELVPSRELDRLIKYNKELLTTRDNLAALIPILQNAALSMEAYNGGYKELSQMSKDFQKLQQDTANATKQYTQAIGALEKAKRQYAQAAANETKTTRQSTQSTDALTRANQRYKQALSDEGKEIAVVNERTRQLNEQNRQAAREATAAEGSLNKLRATLARMKNEAAGMDMGSDEFKQMTADIEQLNAKILAAEAAMGDHRRNVGNYSSAFNNLGFQVQQVARELPSLTMGANQFFLAISNNLPMLADAYKETVERNKELREANKLLAADAQKQVIPAWRQMIKSIISWQTAIVAAITLLSAYGKEIASWVKQLFAGRDALEAVRKAEQELNNEVAKSVTQLDYLLAKLKSAKEGTDEYREARDALVSQYGDYLPNMESEIANLTDELDLRNRLVTAIYKEAAAKKQAETITAAQEEYLKQMEKRLKGGFAQARDNIAITAFSDVYGENAGQMQQALMLGLIGDEQQQNKANEIIGELRAAVRSRGNAYSLDDYEAWVDKITEAADDYFAQVDAAAQMGKNIEAALEYFGGESGDNSEELKTLQTLRTRLSTLEAEAQTLTAENTAAIELNKAERKNLQAQIEYLENLLGLGSDGTGMAGSGGSTGNGGGSSRLSEKRQAELETQRLLLEHEAELQRQTYENEEKSYDERLAALEKYYDLRRQLTRNAFDESMEELDARREAGEIDDATYAAVATSVATASNISLSNLNTEREAESGELGVSMLAGLMEQIGGEVASVIADIDTAETAALTDLASQYAQGLMDTEEYEKRKAEIARKYQEQRLQSEIDILGREFEAVRGNAALQEMIAKELADAQIKYNAYSNAEQIKSDEETAREQEELKKQKEQAAVQLAMTTLDFLGTLNDAALERELNRLDKESEENEKWRDEEIERIERLEERGVITKENAEARKKHIEDQAAANEEKIEAQRAEAERKAAINERLLAIAKATINTAVAVSQVAANPVLAGIVAALGAVQIATILATPIPEYAEGTQDHAGGLAIVGDGGRSELVMLPDGRMWKTPAVDTLVNLPEHSQVLPDYDEALHDALVSSFTMREIPAVEVSMDTSGLSRKLDKLDKLIETNRLLRISLSHADRNAKNSNAVLSKQNNRKLWN